MPEDSTVYQRIGVIGDIHAEDARLQRTLTYLENQSLDAILCTGDVVDGRGCPNLCAQLLDGARILTVRGNHDRWLLSNRARHVPNAHLREQLDMNSIQYLDALPKKLEINTPKGQALLCHGIGDNDLKKVWPGSKRLPMERSKDLDDLLDHGRIRYLINGHMHYRSILYFEGMTLMNAGTLRGDHRPGFSIIDFSKGEVKAFEFEADEIQLVIEASLEPEHPHRIWKNTQEFDSRWTPLTLYGS